MATYPLRSKMPVFMYSARQHEPAVYAVCGLRIRATWVTSVIDPDLIHAICTLVWKSMFQRWFTIPQRQPATAAESAPAARTVSHTKSNASLATRRFATSSSDGMFTSWPLCRTAVCTGSASRPNSWSCPVGHTGGAVWLCLRVSACSVESKTRKA